MKRWQYILIFFVALLWFSGTLQGAIFLWSLVNRIPFWITRGIVQVESAGVETAMGNAGERGLMQLTKEALVDSNLTTGLQFSYDDMWTIWKNIAAGTGYLRWLHNQESNWETCVRAYNVGLVAARNGNGTGYLNKVIEAAK
jgi:soluble lytic murein transglycosylase-like protein